jgi:hypothetical protein
LGLHLVARQLSLFPGWRIDSRRPRLRSMGTVINRAPDQILRSVIAYCLWRAGESWRNPSSPDNRRNEDRLSYLEAIRVINRVRYEPAHLPEPVPAAAAAKPSPKEVALAARPRLQLAAELIAADPSLTDRRLLSHLPKHKLAAMLAARRATA